MPGVLSVVWGRGCVRKPLNASPASMPCAVVCCIGLDLSKWTAVAPLVILTPQSDGVGAWILQPITKGGINDHKGLLRHYATVHAAGQRGRTAQQPRVTTLMV